MAQQYLRACSLIIADQTGNGVELAGPTQSQILRIRFTIEYMLHDTPAHMKARVYNLSDTTIKKIVELANAQPPTIKNVPNVSSARVVLKAGYIANFSTVFQGQVYQLRVGKENNTDTYLDIFAADGDFAYQYSVLRETLAKGYVAEDVWKAGGRSMGPWQVTTGQSPPGLNNNPSPRAKVLFGNTRDVLRDLSATHNFTFNILDGQLQGMQKYAVKPGDAIVINSRTGMVGVPEQTAEGIRVTALLNPAIRWGQRIKLNETDIARLLLNTDKSINAPLTEEFSNNRSNTFVPPLNADGDYVVITAKHVGDTRGNEWYTDMVCLSINTVNPILPLGVSNTLPLPPPFPETADIKPPTSPQ